MIIVTQTRARTKLHASTLRRITTVIALKIGRARTVAIRGTSVRTHPAMVSQTVKFCSFSYD